MHTMIDYRVYSHKALLRPTTLFIDIFTKLNEIMYAFFLRFCIEDSIKMKMKFCIRKFVRNPFTCDKHNLYEIFLNVFLELYIHTWIINVNSILKGKHVRNINDDVKAEAFNRYKVYRGQKLAVTKLKQLN